LSGRGPEADTDDGSAKAIPALCWGALLTVLVTDASVVLQQVSNLGLEGDARRDAYASMAATAIITLIAAALPVAAWLLSRLGGDGAVYVRVDEAMLPPSPIIADRYPTLPSAAPPPANIGAPSFDRGDTGVWRAAPPVRGGGPYMYAAREGVIVWEDGRCNVPVVRLAQDAPVIVVGAVGPFHQVRLPGGGEGVVAKSELRW
jgi:hypothetical protein